MQITSSSRLSYQLMNENDAQLLFELDQNPNVMKYINGGKPSSQKEIAEVLIPRMLSYINQKKGWGLWKVSLLENNEFIGWILVRPMDFFGDNPKFENLELGWRFKEEYWGKGYATESALCVMNALAHNKSASQFTAIAVSENTASISIMKKLGMKFIKKDMHKDPLGDMMVEYYSVTI